MPVPVPRLPPLKPGQVPKSWDTAGLELVSVEPVTTSTPRASIRTEPQPFDWIALGCVVGIICVIGYIGLVAVLVGGAR